MYVWFAFHSFVHGSVSDDLLARVFGIGESLN